MRRSIIAFCVGLGVAGLVVGVVMRASQPPSHDANRSSSTDPLTDRICGGSETTLEFALSKLQGVQLPSALFASDDRLKRVWDCAGGEFAFEYETGVNVYVGPSDFKDPVARWQEIANSDPEAYGTREIQGTTALVADPKVPGAIGGVEFAIGDRTIVVNGNGEIALDDLLAVAESMDFER